MTATDKPSETSVDVAVGGVGASQGPRGVFSKTRTRVVSAVLVASLLVAGVLFVVHGRFTTDEGEDGTRSRYFLDECTDCCDDIAIIGGGVSGTYAAWKLRQRGLSVTVYEYSDRIGGRLHTVQIPGIPDINLEMGGMRFVPRDHPLLTGTARALNLSLVDFAPGLGLGPDTMFYLRGVHIRSRDLGSNRNPYNLKPTEDYLKINPELIKKAYFINYTTYTDGDSLDDATVLYSRTEDGIPLYAQSIEVAYAEMGTSHEAQVYFRDTYGFHSPDWDAVSSYELLIEENPLETGGLPVKVVTIGEGMQALPESLVKEFLDTSSRHKLVKNLELWKIEKKSDASYQLKFWPTVSFGGQTQRKNAPEVTKCAKKVILSVPRVALAAIDWDGFRDPEISKIINHSNEDCPASKIFLAYERPWWRDLPFTFSHSVSDMPNRQFYDFGVSATTGKAVLLAGYTDMEDVSFWHELQSRANLTAVPPGYPIPPSDAAIFHATEYVAKIFNISASSIPKPIGGAISLWDGFPYGGAWQQWMPGFDWTKVGNRIVKPSDSDDVYIATNGFAPDYGSSWVDFALRRTEMALNKMDNS